MKPRQHFWEILGTWVKVKSPQASSLKGRARGGGGGGVGKGVVQATELPHQLHPGLARPEPTAQGSFIYTRHFTWETPSTLPAGKVLAG